MEEYFLNKMNPFIALMMEAKVTSETSVNLYQTTRRSISKYSHLQDEAR
jgi:hypothetical protein